VASLLTRTKQLLQEQDLWRQRLSLSWSDLILISVGSISSNPGYPLLVHDRQLALLPQQSNRRKVLLMTSCMGSIGGNSSGSSYGDRIWK
jgi:hypothetical protein